MSKTQLNALQASEPTQLLDMLNSPADIRALGFSELEQLCAELLTPSNPESRERVSRKGEKANS